MFDIIKYQLLIISLLLIPIIGNAQQTELERCNIVWNAQSKNSGESMPCGGGDIGLNVWVENGELLFYMSQSGAFDENNQLLKAGRVRVKLNPDPFEGRSFKQELLLHDGYVSISGGKEKLSVQINIWVNVFEPIINVEIRSSQPVTTTAAYESWRYQDRPLRGKENNANSWKWANVKAVTKKDSINFENNSVFFYHRNSDSTVFDVTVKQQGLDSIKHRLFNPLKDLCFGGFMQGANMIPAGTCEGKYLDTDFKGWMLKSKKAANEQNIIITLRAGQDIFTNWKKELFTSRKNDWEATKRWWNTFWDRSFIFINTSDTALWQAGRNYQLFRYMLGCNADGSYPTKFNGGLFTCDPVFTDTSFHYSPDHRNWGGGTFTAQNQRLVYWPMLKSGDFDMMQSQFDFYKRILKNAESRSKAYWNHDGACFTEQMENFGLPNMAEYGLKRPAGFDKGLEYNAWLEYEWDTVLEFCMMMLEEGSYSATSIRSYIPLIESCIIFFDEHYQYLAKQRGIKGLDGNGHLILYPGAGAETYKMANNSTSTIAALQTVIKKLLTTAYLNEEDRKKFTSILQRIPPLNFSNFNGHPTIAPAKSWERINNIEPTQLYPVFPWGIYGVGKPGLDTALNTWNYDTLAIKFRSYVGWKQDNIFAARLGLTKEAVELNSLKMKNSGRRFPAFWGPGFDWTPDHNWGGSGMIGLQEMLLQTDDRKIFLFPAWPKDKDVHFKLHAPYNTIVEAEITSGKVNIIAVIPEERRNDIIVMLK